MRTEAQKKYHREWMRDWRLADPEKARAKDRARNAANPRRLRKNNLKNHYGVTIEQFDAMLAAQGGKCAICPRTEPDGRHKQWNVDHCHSSGKVRGLLCTQCNKMLGSARDNIETLQSAIHYLGG